MIVIHQISDSDSKISWNKEQITVLIEAYKNEKNKNVTQT